MNTRVRNSVEEKKRWLTAISAGVSPEGQKLYMAISKTIKEVSFAPNFSHFFFHPVQFIENFNRLKIQNVFVYMQVTWMGTSIVVFNDVKIRPPYRLENVTGQPGSKQLNYVRKMVERLTKERPTTSSHHSMALMQSQPLPQRRNSNGNGPAPSTKITERNASSNIKAN